jgi:long-chain acyl-CoA synthetase
VPWQTLAVSDAEADPPDFSGPGIGAEAGPTNVADTVRLAAIRDPAAPALIAGPPENASVITWGELDARVDAVAAALRGLNLPSSMGNSARVAIGLPQVPEFAEVFFGVLRAGLVAVPINPDYTPRELRHVLLDSGASVLVTTGAVSTELASVRADLPLLLSVYSLDPVGGARPLSELASSPAAVPTTRSSDDLAVLLYTSGTSGAPKGAMLPHRALLANQSQVAALDPPVVGPDDVVLLALPMFHIFGLNAGLVAVANHGAIGVLLDRFDPALALEAIARHRVSVVTAVPQMYAAWLSVPELALRLGSVRVAVSGGAPLPAEVARRYREATGFVLYQGYGLTETAPVLTTSLASPVPKVGSIGRPIPGVTVRLVGSDGAVAAEVSWSGLDSGLVDDFEDDAGGAPGTDPGQIVVRGENLFLGYWPDGSDGPDVDGWWATGDVAYADEDGDLFLVDRLGDLILVSGFNVYPREVEQVLIAHPRVADAAVVGVPDATTGEAVLAYVVPSDGAPLSTDELNLYCGRNLARYKCPRVFEVVTELPRTAIGKVRKASLRANLEASRPPSDADQAPR